MTDLAAQLERLGLEQYLDAFVGEGFDTWEILLDVQESDLEALNVKLGHRRKLQRAIAEYRGISYERLVGSPAAQDALIDPTRSAEGAQGAAANKEGTSVPPVETKRKYRRHPKVDDNAPEKPPSAYVLFSNRVREEVKSENLSFTEIAKLVGDRWQKLDPFQKEPFESEATARKEQYNAELAAYKKTDLYREYAQYLSDFKAKHGPQPEPKRPKLDAQSSGGSLSAASVEAPDAFAATAGYVRMSSIGSVSATPPTSSNITSPAGPNHTPGSSMPSMVGTGTRALASLHRPGSPQTLQYGRERRLVGQLSSHSSNSDDSGQVPYDPLSRTANLSLNTPPTGTPPLPPHTLSGRSDTVGSSEPFPWTSRVTQSSQQAGLMTPSGPSPLGTGITLPSPTFAGEPWRERGIDWTRPIQTSPAASTPGQVPPPSLPPMISPDRLSDIGHGQVQRTLPPLRQSTTPSLTSQSSYQSSSSLSQISRQVSVETERRHSQIHDGGSRQIDRNENEAASALAGLAARPGSDNLQSRGHDRR